MVIVQGANFAKIANMMAMNGTYKDFRETARNNKLHLSPSSKYAIYDNFEKRITDNDYSRNYVELEDECRKMNDDLLYDKVIEEFVSTGSGFHR